MTARGHLLFAVGCTLLVRQTELLPSLNHAPLWQLLPAALLGGLLPDLDHPKSVLGQWLPFISRPLARLFGHRGFTHSLLATGLVLWGVQSSLPGGPEGVKKALLLGYLSHLLGDLLTPAGIPLLWPLRRRFALPLLQPRHGPLPETLVGLTLLAVNGWWSGWLQ
ncbi:metal-dependent hydrolase [Aeromonas diversa]|nr:metal-dependent hydrolase [Aeromonas diversa]